jgi:hypothetical protein
VWNPTLATMPPTKPSKAKTPRIFILSFTCFTLLLLVNSSCF